MVVILHRFASFHGVQIIEIFLPSRVIYWVLFWIVLSGILSTAAVCIQHFRVAVLRRHFRVGSKSRFVLRRRGKNLRF